MKIKKIEILSYGKWFQKTFDVHPELQVFTGPNESGKSSIMNIINGILYGFPKRKNGKFTFESELSAVSGGKLTIEDERFGEVIVERTVGKAKQTLTITKSTGEEIPDLTMEELLYNVSEANFAKTYSFNLQQLQEVKNISPDELHRYFLSIGLSGSEQLLEVSEQLKKAADSIYTKASSTRELDKKIKQLNQSAQKVRASKNQDELYQQLLQQEQELSGKLAEEKTIVDKLQEKKDYLANLNHFWPSYQQWKSLKEQINQKDYQQVDENLADEYKSLKAKEQQIQQRSEKIEEQVTELAISQQPIAEQKWFMENESLIKEIIRSQEEITNLEHDLQTQQQHLLILNERIAGLKQQLAITDEEDVPEAFSQEELEQLRRDLERVDDLERTRLVSLKNQTASQERIDQMNQEISEMKEQLLPAKEVEQMKTSLEEAQGTKARSTGVVPIVVAIGLMILAFILPAYKWVFLAGIIVTGLSYFVMTKKPQLIDENQKDSFIKLIERQTSFETKIDYAETMKQEIHQEVATAANQYYQLEEEILTLDKKLKQAIEAKGYRKNSLPLETIIMHNPVEKLHQLLKKQQDLIEELDANKIAKQEWLTKITFYDDTKPTELFEYLKTIQDSYHRCSVRLKEQELKEQQVIELKQELTELENDIIPIQERIAEIYRLTNTTNYESLIEFWQEKTMQEDIRKQELLLRQSIEELVPAYQEFIDQQDLENAVEISQQNFQLSQNKTLEITEELANIKQKIESLEESGIYQEQLEEFAQDAQDMRELVVKWGANRLASDVLQRTLLSGKEDKLDQVVKDASAYFKRLTNERYQSLTLTKTKAKVKRQDGKVFTIKQLSRGTLDQLYVALRLAFVKNSAEFAPLPMIIDDGFVNFDNERKQEMLALLKEVSQSVQIIYFTFDTDMAEYFAKDQITVLTRQ